MATIHKLTKDGSTIFPATITDAVVHPNTGKTLTSMIKDYNVSELFPSEGLDGGNQYNLALAIQVLGTHLTAEEKTGGIKLTFISTVSPHPEEEYYLQKNTWSTNVADWGQRFEVGDVIADPTGTWNPGTAEAYIDQQVATFTTDLASETAGRQAADTNLQTQINFEVSNRTEIDDEQNTRIGVLEEAYQRFLDGDDIIVGPRPTTGQQANVIYREPDQDHTPPQFYSDYMWYGSPADWVLMAQYDNGIDNYPLPNSNNIVKSSGVFNTMGAFDISAYNSGTTYLNLTSALNAVPQTMRAGGMSVKFIQEIPAQYTVVRTAGLETEPTGTELSTDPNIVSGTYTAAQLNNLNTVSALPSTLNTSKTYYLEVSATSYTTWVVTYVQTSDNMYVQFRYMLPYENTTAGNAAFLKVENWQGVDDEAKSESKNIITSKGCYNLVYLDSPNLFDKDAEGVLNGKLIDYAQNGAFVDWGHAITSDYIPVQQGVKYCVTAYTSYYGTTNGKNVASYNTNKENYVRLAGALKDNNKYIEFTAQRDGYVRFSISDVFVNTAMMVEGTEYPSVYYPYGTKCIIPEVQQLKTDVSELQNNVSTNIVTINTNIETANADISDIEDYLDVVDDIIYLGENLFNKDAADVENGKYINYSNSGNLSNDTLMFTSGYIPVKAGQKYVVKAAAGYYGASNGKNVASYDSNKENYERLPGTLKDNNNYIEFTANRDGYVRFSLRTNTVDTAMMLKGTVYSSEYKPYGLVVTFPEFTQLQVQVAELQSNPFIPLFSKRVLWLGDSIGEAASCGEGVSGTQRFGWSGRVAEKYSGTFYSLARSGATITKNLGDGVTSILTKLEELYNGGHTGQYLIIEGGTNDADRIGSILDEQNLPAKFGIWDKNNYSGNYDEETFCGAVDSLFYKALTHYKGVKIGFMIAQKMGAFSGTPRVNNYVIMENRRAYFDVIKEMCKKWGIPCFDMWDNTWLNPDLVNHYDLSKNGAGNIEAGSYYTDGQHLTAAAYDYLAPVIGEWLETL